MPAGGYGSGGYGALPWGSAGTAALPTPPPEFDIFCFYDVLMLDILSDVRVTLVDAGGQFVLPSGDGNDLGILSGGAAPDDTAVLSLADTVPQSWTLETIIKFEDLPNGFSDIVGAHFFVGATDGAGPCAGLFISKIGVAYTGGISHAPSGDLQLDSVLQVLPGSVAYIETGKYINFRIAADSTTDAVYIYITELSELLSSGPQLRYVLPLITYDELTNPPFDRALVSTRGTVTEPVSVLLDTFCMGTGVITPNLQPKADAGRDQAVRTCTVVQLDGSGSYDPEGTPILYQWRLIDGPTASSFVFEGGDGTTYPKPVPTGFTDLLHSDDLGTEAALDPIVAGDVLTIDGESYTITGSGVDGNGFYISLALQYLPDDLVGTSFKVLRSRALSGATTVNPTFLPDAPGIYRFDLTVNDGSLDSETGVVIVNVLESYVPKGIVPDVSFLWNQISNFWKLVEDGDRIEAIFEGVAQVAAAELLTLWQSDYSKSLRDIQRTFQRRWLHYDLLLPEPVPELTRPRQVRGGIESSAVLDAGISGVQGTVLVLSSPVWEEDITLTFRSANPYTPADLQNALEVALGDLHITTITVGVYYASATESFIRLDAAHPMEVAEETTSTLFTVGDANVHPVGASGLAVGTRTYKVERSLEGLDIQEGDILSIDGVGYLISRVIDSSSDSLRYQRLVVQRDLPLLPGSTWEISGTITSKLIDFYNGLVSADDIVTLEVYDNVEQAINLVEVAAVTAAQLAPTKLALDLTSVDGYLAMSSRYTVRLAKVLRHRYVPIDSLVVDVPILHENIRPTTQEEVLHRNVDFFIEEFRGQNCIRFVVPSSPGPDVWEGESPPDRMWAEVTYIDNRPLIEANFGIPAGLTVDQMEEASLNVDYLSAVRGLWYAHLHGPTMRNLRIGTQILLGLPFAEESGTIEEIRDDFSPNEGRILIRDAANTEIVRTYSYPRVLELEVNPDTGEQYAIGDSVQQFAPLVEGAAINDYVKDPRWFSGLLAQGLFYEIQKFHTFMVTVDADVFNLSALLFASSFVQLVKPTYTRPIVLVRRDVAETEVSVSESVEITATLWRDVHPCTPFGSTAWDVPRSAGGGEVTDTGLVHRMHSQYDGDAQPYTDYGNPPTLDPAPVPPTPESPIVWAYDKMYYCPEYVIDMLQWVAHGGGAMSPDPPYAAPFTLGGTINPFHRFEELSVTSIPATTGETIGSPSSVAITSDLETVLLDIDGDPGSDPTDYVLVFEVNSSDVHTEAFTAQPGGVGVEFNLSPATVSLTAADSLEFRIRAADSSARSPNWTRVTIRALQADYTVGATVPAGNYAKLYTETSLVD
jgi:hypothetical protein